MFRKVIIKEPDAYLRSPLLFVEKETLFLCLHLPKMELLVYPVTSFCLSMPES